MREESSFWMLHSGDKVERVQVSGRLSANNVGMLGRLAGQGLGITPLLVFDRLARRAVPAARAWCACCRAGA